MPTLRSEYEKIRENSFGYIKIVYNITKQLCGKYNKRIGETVKVRYGRILTTEIKVAKRWKTHFKELLNRP